MKSGHEIVSGICSRDHRDDLKQSGRSRASTRAADVIDECAVVQSNESTGCDRECKYGASD
jgi:hypothetical protein